MSIFSPDDEIFSDRDFFDPAPLPASAPSAQRVAPARLRLARSAAAAALTLSIAASLVGGLPLRIHKGRSEAPCPTESPPSTSVVEARAAESAPHTPQRDAKASLQASLDRLRERGVPVENLIHDASANLMHWKSNPEPWEQTGTRDES